jgi:hypothetical protein
MKSFIGGLIAGAVILGAGVALGKPSPRRPRHFARRRIYRGSYSRPNPGAFEREALAYMREARELIQELRNPKTPTFEPYVPFEGAEFVRPGTAHVEAEAQDATRDAKKERLICPQCFHPSHGDFCPSDQCPCGRSQDAPPEANGMNSEQWHMLCMFMFRMLEDEGNKQFKAELRRQMDLSNAEPCPTPGEKQPWKVIQDGLGNWNVWEWGPRDGLAPKSVALSLTEENARQIVSDHNRAEAQFISNETMALRKILDMATDLLQGPVYSDTKTLMRICDEADAALGLRNPEAKS